MFTLSKNQNFKVIGLAVLLFLSSACNLTDDGKSEVAEAFTPPPPEQQAPPYVPAPQCEVERFYQPSAEIVKKVDILFLTDTSGSLDDERGQIADGLDAFIAELPADVDYQVGVMYGHVRESNGSGELVTTSTNPKVLKSSTMTLAQIRTQVSNRMRSPRGEIESDGGEAMMYALYNALHNKLAINRAQGFFREDAALAIVLITDENDLCSFGLMPSNVTPVPDPDGKEWTAYQNYCDPVDPQTINNLVKAAQGERPYLISSIVYTGETPVPQSGENEIGYGVIDTVNMANGINIDMATGDFDAGMQQLGFLTYKKLNLLTEFNLSRNDFVKSSLKVFVDNVQVAHSYVESINQVQLAEAVAGDEGSEVAITYCMPVIVLPVITSLRVFRIQFTTTDLEWASDVPTSEKLVLTNKTTGVKTTFTDAVLRSTHGRRFTGLTQNTGYSLEVTATNAAGNSAVRTIDFKTLNEADF